VKQRGRLLPSAVLPGGLLGNAPRIGTSRCPQPEYALGSPGRPAAMPTLLIAAFDNSGSVVSPIGADPLSNRFAEVDRAFSVIARNGAPHEFGMVLHFDTPSDGEIGPVPITRAGMRQLRRGLRVPEDGAGSSELAPSLRRARQVAEAHPVHETTLVVLSDFLLMDADPREVLSDLAAFPGAVHAVVLGTRLPAGVLDGAITVTHVGRDDPPGTVAQALFASLVRHRQRRHYSARKRGK